MGTRRRTNAPRLPPNSFPSLYALVVAFTLVALTGLAVRSAATGGHPVDEAPNGRHGSATSAAARTVMTQVTVTVGGIPTGIDHVTLDVYQDNKNVPRSLPVAVDKETQTLTQALEVAKGWVCLHIPPEWHVQVTPPVVFQNDSLSCVASDVDRAEFRLSKAA